MPSNEELLRRFAKRDLTVARPSSAGSERPAAADAADAAPAAESGEPGTTRPQGAFRRLRRAGLSDDDPGVTLEGLFDEKDGLIGLGG